jgi:hypothetical protein
MLPEQAVTTIPLGRPSPDVSCDRPERRREGPPGAVFRIAPKRAPAAPTWSCSRWGFPCRCRCQQRGALLPHHFTLAARPIGSGRLGGVLSVALSLGSPPPGVTRHRTSVEPGLSSPCSAAKSGRPAVWQRSFGQHQRVCQARDRGSIAIRSRLQSSGPPARALPSGSPK